jgi:hypothetical protein
MSAIPADLSTEQGPPMSVPLGHFVVGFGFLLSACLLAGYVGLDGTLPSVGAIHLLLAGWVGITIMGAMTQFVAVWSGVELHSRRLSRWQLWPVVAGVPLLAAGMTTGRPGLLVAGGTLATLGFWLFAYNIGRTLAAARPLDPTETHFACALGFFVLATSAGFTLASVYAGHVTAPVPVGRLRATHATLAVLGALLTTVFGALYQLATVFTGTALRGIERPLQSVETYGYPVGVLALAGSRLLAAPWVGRIGAALVCVSAVAMAFVLARRVLETRHDLTPMLQRYLLVAVALAGWAILAASAWLRTPTDPTVLFGPAGADRLLWLGVVGIVVLGSLYHVVPFIVWVNRYSDRLGHEPVPLIDDLYDDRLAAADLVAVTGGVLALVGAEWVSVPGLEAAGLALVTVGAVLFLANMAVVLLRHGPSMPSLLAEVAAVRK